MADQIFNANSGFWDAQNGDRTYSADDMNKPYKRLVCDGVFATPEGTPSEDFQVFATSGMTISVHAGDGIFGAKWVHAEAQPINIPENSTAYTRIDSVIVQVDSRTTGRKSSVIYRTGTPASSPTAPAINEISGVLEFRIANISVASGATTITQANITDLRGIETNWVAALIQQLDTSQLMLQYTAALEQYMAGERQAWNDFLQTLTDELSVTMNLVEHKQDIVTVSSGTTFQVPFQDYDPMTDTLQVFVNGLLASEGTDYTYSAGYITFTTALEADQTISFHEFKAVIGGNIASVTLLLTQLEAKIDAALADSGWQTLTLKSGFTAGSTPMVRKIGKHVYMRGSCKGSFSAGTLVTEIPEGFRPPYYVRFTENGSAGTIGWKIQDDGKMYCEYKQGTVNTTAVVGMVTSWVLT